jgi:hypothetical protein
LDALVCPVILALGRLRPEDHLIPGVQYQPGQHKEAPSQKIKNKKREIGCTVINNP